MSSKPKKKNYRARAIVFSLASAVTLSFIAFVSLNVACDRDVFFTLALTFGATAYHFDMRLLVGYAAEKISFDPESRWFRPRKGEETLYRILRVKAWKNRLVTFKPENFDLSRSKRELIQNMCVAEIVHECIFVLSWVSLLFTLFCDSFYYFWIFFGTAFFASLFDLISVIVQRYNRPRMSRLLKREEMREKI